MVVYFIIYVAFFEKQIYKGMAIAMAKVRFNFKIQSNLMSESLVKKLYLLLPIL